MADIVIKSRDIYFRAGMEALFSHCLLPLLNGRLHLVRVRDLRDTVSGQYDGHPCDGEIEFLVVSSRFIKMPEQCPSCRAWQVFIDADLSVPAMLAQMRSALDGYTVPLVPCGGSGSGYSFTARENKIISRLANGMSVKDIAEVLSLSRASVSDCKCNIMNKMGFRHKVSLCHWILTGGQR